MLQDSYSHSHTRYKSWVWPLQISRDFCYERVVGDEGKEWLVMKEKAERDHFVVCPSVWTMVKFLTLSLL